jgi:hypothetical protein
VTALATYAAQRHADGSAYVWLLIAVIALVCTAATVWSLLSDRRR